MQEEQGKREGRKHQKLDVWRPSEPGCSCNPTFLLFYYVLEQKITGESDGKSDKNVSYNRSPQIRTVGRS